jgi:hypothetical protein
MPTGPRTPSSTVLTVEERWSSPSEGILCCRLMTACTPCSPRFRT